MQNVVFTGPAFDNHGRAVLRANLIAASEASGRFRVQSAVTAATQILVASRTDTVKAKKAAALGVEVMTYPEFIGRELAGVDLKIGVTPNAYSPYVDKGLLIPDFTVGLSEDDLL